MEDWLVVVLVLQVPKAPKKHSHMFLNLVLRGSSRLCA